MSNHAEEMLRRRYIPFAGLALAAVATATFAGSAAGPVAMSEAAGRSVILKDIAFSPKRLTISRGTTVTFRWRDDGTGHDVVSVGRKKFKSISERSSGSKPVRFTGAGTYRYVCTLHPGMSGQITVR